MRRMTILTPLLLLGGSWPCVAPRCECGPKPSADAAYADAARVFTGRILRVDTIEAVFDSGGVRRQGYEVSFVVLRSWKGTGRDTVSIATFTTCNRFFYDPVVGQSFLVYAERWREPTRVGFVGGQYAQPTRLAAPLGASECGHTAPVDSAEADLRWLAGRQRSGR